MLHKVSEIHNSVLEALDGEIGRCKDFLFDERFWTVRYMVADTGKWLSGRKVLISPISLGRPDWRSGRLPVKLSREKIKGSPPLETDQPISRQYEIRWFDYFGWPYYWLGPGAWGAVPNPADLYEQQQEARPEPIEPEANHLRSTEEVDGYHIAARDGDIGHVEDFLVEADSWSIRYLVVDTRNWLPGRKVLVAVDWADNIDWREKKVHIDLDRDQIEDSPEYDPSAPPDRDFETALYNYYGFPPYWERK
jgi:hypothetical protein